MRTRLTAPALPSSPQKQPKRLKIGRQTPVEPSPKVAALNVPDLPAGTPYRSLRDVWRPAHTKSLLNALGDVHPYVARAARAIASQQVAFDGLIYLRGEGVLDIAASTRAMPEALRLFDSLLRAAADSGAKVTVPAETKITLQEETFKIRLREKSDRRTKRGSSQIFGGSEYVPTGQLWLIATHEEGSEIRLHAHNIDNVYPRLRRLVDRLPRLRHKRYERQRARNEEWARRQAQWKREEDQRRQWREQQERFNEVTGDIEQWTKAEHIRAYAAAFEAHQIATNGAIEPGSVVDGWLRWIHWYAHHLDPITRPEGPKQGPPREG